MSKPEVFVFGSNLAGRHGKAAALVAKNHYGAETGVGEGPTGMAYAIPTKDSRLRTRSLDDIKVSVDKFIRYATQMPHIRFHVTRIGCGLAGYSDDQIAPMFKDAPINCDLPNGWRER